MYDPNKVDLQLDDADQFCNISDLKECPDCGYGWDGGDIIAEFKRIRDDESDPNHKYWADKTDAEILESAKCYGWTEEDPRRFSNLHGIETPGYDGVSFWQCPKCKATWDRFTGQRRVSPV